MATEDPVFAALAMDRSIPIGNSVDAFGRRALHAIIGNDPSQAFSVSLSPDPNATVVNIYDEALSVIAGVDTDVVMYTVPASLDFYLERIQVSGENIANYKVTLNNVTIDRVVTYFSGELAHTFDFSSALERGLKLSAGDVLKVVVRHSRPSSADFYATIKGVTHT